jgi:hypothetical protein
MEAERERTQALQSLMEKLRQDVLARMSPEEYKACKHAKNLPSSDFYLRFHSNKFLLLLIYLM